MALVIFSDHGKKVAKEHGLERSRHWSSVAKKFLAANPRCAACEKTTVWTGIFAHQIHHKVVPFHLAVLLGRPDLELDFRNLVTLCQVPMRQHHLLLGHLDDFKSFNPDCDAFIAKFFGMSAKEIEAHPEWQKAEAARPRTWENMVQGEKDMLRKRLDELLPPDPKVLDLIKFC